MNNQTLSSYLQDSILYLSITDTNFLNMVRGCGVEDAFHSEIPAKCFEICCDYLNQFNKAPGKHFHDEVIRWTADLDEDKKSIIVDYIKRIQEVQQPDKEYVLSRIHKWVRQRTLEKGILQAAEIAERDLDEAERVLYEALESGIEQQEAGLDYFNDFTSLNKRSMSDNALISTGITNLDRIIGGFDKGQLVCIMGGPKGMKSWCLMHLGKSAILQNLNVLHISHELSEAECEARYDGLFGSFVDGRMGLHKEPTDESNHRKDWWVDYWYKEDGIIKKMRELRPSLSNVSKVMKCRERVRKLGGKLFIKKFPMHSCSMDMLKSYIHYIEHFENFHPDVIINDYVDIMAIDDSKELRHQLNFFYMEHKRLADEHNILMLTASQVNREAVKSRVINKSNFAEDLRKAANVDLALGVCQTTEENKKDRARIYVVANRNGPEEVWCGVGTAIQMGQFALYSQTARELREDSLEEENQIIAEVEEEIGGK